MMRKKPRAVCDKIEECMLSVTKKREELAVAMADLECRIMKRYAVPVEMNIGVPNSGGVIACTQMSIDSRYAGW
jgi:hypothetical protein